MHTILKNSLERFRSASNKEKEVLLKGIKVQIKLSPREIRNKYLMTKKEFIELTKKFKEIIKEEALQKN